MYHLLISPLTWGLLLAAVLWLSWRRMGLALRAASTALALVLLVSSTPFGANLLLRYVESRTPAADFCGSAMQDAPIVALSGGFDREPQAADDYAALHPESWRRLRSAVALWRGDRDSRLLITGGGPYAIKESAMQASLARDWGVPSAALRIETRSRTTWESASALRGILPERIRLVTSAIHQPRALIAFRAAGFEPCAHADDFHAPLLLGWGAFVPQSSAIEKTEMAVYELIGAIAYGRRTGDGPRESGAVDTGHGRPQADWRGAPAARREVGRLPSTTSKPPSLV